MAYYLPSVALLITHYNRSQSLARLLSNFKQLDVQFGQVVVSDDGSDSFHLNSILALQEHYNFELVTTKTNKGLGNNINKGQDKITKLFTLYVQEDFVPKEKFLTVFPVALQFMENDKDLDIIRFYAYFKYPKLQYFKMGFSRMIYSPWNFNHLKFYFYSDHPHLRRSNFFEKFGRYKENCNPNKSEFSMVLSFIKNHASGLFFDDFTTLFDQVNSSAEPSTINGPNWRTKANLPIKILRRVYLPFRFIKNTIELAFK